MESMKNEVCSGIRIAVMVTMILLGVTTIACAEVYLPNTFSPGTTISSSQVNDNFQLLAKSMPGWKSATGGSSVTLSTQWQNVASLTVTPPMDGNIILLGTASVTIIQGSTAGGSGYGFSNVTLCMTQTSGGGSPCNGALVTFDTPPTGASLGNYAPRLRIPVTIIGESIVVKNTPVTYYLTAAKESGSVGSAVINTSALTAIFFPGGELP